jgi:drug/metabolite transporter (DMT)-like permease
MWNADSRALAGLVVCLHPLLPDPWNSRDRPSPQLVATPRTQRRALWIAFALIVVWGTNFTVQKLIFPILTPAGFLFARFLLLPLCAAVWMVYRYGVDWPPIDRRDLIALVKLALVGHVLHVGLVTYGINLSTAFSSSLILACGPMFTLLLLRFTGVEKLRGAQVAGVALACAGVLVFLSDKLVGQRWQAGGGDLILLVAASFFSYYTVAAKPMIMRLGGAPVMAYTTFIASPLLVALSWQAGMGVPWGSLAAEVWVGILWGVLVSTFVGWMVWGWVNAVRGVARTAPLMYLMPMVAGAVSWYFIGEVMTLNKLVGAAITLAGVAIAQYGSSLFVSRRLPPVA